jgi:hypothetical protein
MNPIYLKIRLIPNFHYYLMFPNFLKYHLTLMFR